MKTRNSPFQTLRDRSQDLHGIEIGGKNNSQRRGSFQSSKRNKKQARKNFQRIPRRFAKTEPQEDALGLELTVAPKGYDCDTKRHKEARTLLAQAYFGSNH